MSLGLRLSLLLLIAGCASELLVVPDSDWQTVPATQRDAVDRQLAADLATARAELTAATAGLAAIQRAQPAPPRATPAPPTAPKPATGGDESSTALHEQEQARVGAVAQIEAAKTTWQRADLTWRKLRLDAANAHIAVVMAQRELVRAQTIEHNLPGSDTYNIPPLRGQFSQAQQRWYGLVDNARQARAALERASAALAAAKEAYAQLMRNGTLPPSTRPSIASDDRPPPLQLTGWAVARSDVHRRRGLRHFLDAGASPQLRSVAIQLSTRRSAQAISLGMAPIPAAAATDGKPAGEAPRGTAPTTVAKPVDHPAAPTSPAISTAAGKPAGRPPSPTSPGPLDRPASQADAPKR